MAMVNPYDDKKNELINRMMQQSQNQPPQMYNPAPYQGFNPANNQSYQAALREAQRNAGQATNNAMVSAGSKGIGNSSLLADRMAQIQQNSMGRVSDTLLPQYEQMDYNRYRDFTNDQFKVNEINYNRSQDQYRTTNDLSRFMADLSQRGQDNARADASLTGHYMPDGAQEIINRVLNLKQQAERPGVNTDQMGQFKSEADQYRAQLQRMGIDPSIVGFDADYNQASQNAANFRGIPTLQAQNQALQAQQQQFNQNVTQQDMEYRQIRDQLSDERDQRKFDEDARRFGLEYAANEAYRKGQMSISQQNADTSRMDAERRSQLPEDMPKTAQDYIRTIDESIFLSPQYENNELGNPVKTGKTTVNDPQGLADYIFMLDLPESETRKLFSRYGLRWGG